MKRLIAVTFLFLGWVFYEMSGGADFVPEGRIAAPQVAEADTTPEPAPEQVTPVAAAMPEPEPEPILEPVVEIAAVPAVPAVAEVAEPAPSPEPVLVSLAVPLADTRRVAANNLNVRAGPSTGDPVLTQLALDETVTLVSDNGAGWALIRVEGDGVEGWVASRYLSD